MARLGGTTPDLPVGQGTYAFEFEDGVVMDGATQEHIKEAAPVLSQYCEAIGVRSSELDHQGSRGGRLVRHMGGGAQGYSRAQFRQLRYVPVINLESNVFHPCQGLGDALTLREQFGQTQGKKYVLTWAYHPKPLPTATPHSQLLAACDMGCDVTLAFPEGWDLDTEVMHGGPARAAQAGGSLTITHDHGEAAGEPTSSAPRAGARSATTATGTPKRRVKQTHTLDSGRGRSWRVPTTPASCTACRCGATWSSPMGARQPEQHSRAAGGQSDVRPERAC